MTASLLCEDIIQPTQCGRNSILVSGCQGKHRGRRPWLLPTRDDVGVSPTAHEQNEQSEACPVLDGSGSALSPGLS